MRGSSLGTMIVGLLLALGMAGLLLVWLAMESSGPGIIGFLLMGGVVAGLIVVLIGASSARDGN